MSDHTVTITDDLKIAFTCNADAYPRDGLYDVAACHYYPDCQCESWDDDHKHPSVIHDKCWMQDWFDNDGIAPSSDVLDEVGYTAGMSGPIKTYFREEYIEWEFANEAQS